MATYHKLVRDKIPDIIREKGGAPVTHVADDAEYWQKLLEKLQEEVDEFVESKDPEELADLYEVIDAICAYKKLNKDDILATQKRKAERRGAFTERIILEES
jgi:predicted house-cleaning noncanonical NTP pyrophosphatase (MazG superfamily)